MNRPPCFALQIFGLVVLRYGGEAPLPFSFSRITCDKNGIGVLETPDTGLTRVRGLEETLKNG